MSTFYTYTREHFHPVYCQDVKVGDKIAYGNTSDHTYGVLTVKRITTLDNHFLLWYRLPYGAQVTSSEELEVSIDEYDSEGPVIIIKALYRYGTKMLKEK